MAQHLVKPTQKEVSSPARGRGRPRSDAADRAIRQAALQVFIERGIDAASIEQIADYAGVARTTLYRRWSSKEDLIAQAIASARGEGERQAANRARSRKSPGPLIDALADLVTRPEYRRLAARLIGSVPSCPKLMATYWTNYLLPRRSAMALLIEEARHQGIVRKDCDPEILLDVISGAVIHHLLVRPGNRTRSEMRTYLNQVLRQFYPAER
ncbi:MAG TPA: TetR/AcrR family transcriptional regulator [Candidatus Binataceae bacterium]|nr:TetR/AcrR family transcriptional regulator [Candidatus Binataceae bacterium]